MAAMIGRIGTYLRREFAPEKLKWDRIVEDEKKGRSCPHCGRFGFYIHLPTTIREYWWGFYRCRGCRTEYRPRFTKGNMLFLVILALIYFNYFGQNGFTYATYLKMAVGFAFALSVNYVYAKMGASPSRTGLWLGVFGWSLAAAATVLAHHGEGVANGEPKDILYLIGSTGGFTFIGGSLLGLIPGVQTSIEGLLELLLGDEELADDPLGEDLPRDNDTRPTGTTDDPGWVFSQDGRSWRQPEDGPKDAGWGQDDGGTDGHDKGGYDQEGFDKDGYNRAGFDRHGYDHEGYDARGYDPEGYDREGFDANGYDADGYDREGYDPEGYDRDGYDGEGYDREGYDTSGLDRNGYDKEGYNAEGRDNQGYDKEGFDTNGYDRTGYDKDGYDRAGHNKDGYNKDGFNKDGYDRGGYDKDGFDQDGYNRKGFNQDGLDREGYDPWGFDKDGLNREGKTREQVVQELRDRQKRREQISGSSAGWLGDFLGEFAGGAGRDIASLPGYYRNKAGELIAGAKDVARGMYNEATDANNWKALKEAAGQTFDDLVNKPGESADKITKFYSDVAQYGRNIANGIYKDPGRFIKSVLGVDNWSKVVDGEIPPGERVARALYGAVDTTVTLAGGAEKVAQAADKISDAVNAVRGADVAGDAARAAQAAEAMADGARGAQAADHAADAARGAAAADSAADASKAAGAADSAGDAGRAASAGDHAADSERAAEAAGGAGTAAGATQKGDKAADTTRAAEAAEQAGGTGRSAGAADEAAQQSKNLIGVTKGETARIRRALPEIPGLKASGAMGSRVTGGARLSPSSDIDILAVIDGDPFHPDVLKAITKVENSLSAQLGKKVNITFVSEEAYWRDWAQKVPFKSIE